MRLAFMGTPDFAVTALDALAAAGHTIAAVYTQPPRPANRGRLTPSPVHRRADELGLPVRTPERLKSPEEQAAFAALNLDVALVAAYGLILPRAILDAPRRGCINIHASLLPRWRGAAPVQRAILAGDSVTGVSIMQMEAGLDSGPMLLQGAIPIHRQTAGELTAELADLGAQLMLETLAKIDSLSPTPQPDDGVTYAAKIDKAEARIAWASSAHAIDRLVRAMQPSPGAWFMAGGARVKLLTCEPAEGHGPPGALLPAGLIATADAAIRPIRVQPQGRPAMEAGAWLRGLRLADGEPLL